MQDPIGEACEAVQAAAAGKDEAAIRWMLTAELRSREVDLLPGLFDVLVKQIAAGTYAPDRLSTPDRAAPRAIHPGSHRSPVQAGV